MEARIQFKHEADRPQFDELATRNPTLWSAVWALTARAARVYGDSTVVTSVYRPLDTDSVHGHWRGVDLRIYHPDRWPEDPGATVLRECEKGWMPSTALELKQWLETWLKYDEEESHEVAVIHGEGSAKHFHLQLGSWSAL